MPELSRDQATYYRDKWIWREAHRVALERNDGPPIFYYWWLGGDLNQTRQAQIRLVEDQIEALGVDA